MTLEERFWSKVAVGGPDECWPWKGGISGGRYGMFWMDGRVQCAHRAAWQIHNGPIPEGMAICHHCDNPPCVNPAHLFLGSDADNLRDAANKGRCMGQSCPPIYGEAHGNSKMTEAQVLELRTLYDTGKWSHRSLAGRYGVSARCVYSIVHRITWAHVAQEEN